MVSEVTPPEDSPVEPRAETFAWANAFENTPKPNGVRKMFSTISKSSRA
jgi:hypothetical protein